MEIRVLRYFLTVVREESVTQAANVLHITQPTLSRQLAQMEKDLGVKLFQRDTRKFQLTAEGWLLRRRAEEIITLVDKAEEEMNQQRRIVEGVISIGCGDISAVQLLPELFRGFHEKYPRCTFDLYTATAEHVAERIDQGLTDIGILLYPVSVEKYEAIPLNIAEEWVVAMSPDSKLAQQEAVTPEDLFAQPLILPRRPQVRDELAAWFGDAYDSLQVLFTSNLTTNGAIIVQAGLAYALVVEGSLRFWDPQRIVYRPLRPALSTSSVMVWKRHTPLGRAVEKFIAYAKEYFAQSDINAF